MKFERARPLFECFGVIALCACSRSGGPAPAGPDGGAVSAASGGGAQGGRSGSLAFLDFGP